MAKTSASSPKTSWKTKMKKGSQPYLYLLPTLVLMLILLVIPIINVIRYSFYDNVIVKKNPVFVGLKNYSTILHDSRFWDAVGHSLIFVIVSVIAHMLIGMLFANLLNTRYFRTGTKAIMRTIYALPWMFTASVIAILWKMMMNNNGILNYILVSLHMITKHIDWLGDRHVALAAVTLINIWSGYPFYMISILAGLQGISGDLYEASAIDGAGAVQQFFSITLPQLKPILISLIMLDFVWTLQQFALIWMTTGGGPINATDTVSTYIYKKAFSQYQYSLSSTAAVLLLIVCIVIGIFYVRQQRKAAE